MEEKMEEKIKLSQCMIVKNEEKNIERALSWGKDIMWEQIVVDTGSTDRTVELAEKMGAKIYHFSWIDDFSAAKNYAIEQAEGDWIVFLDADEYFLPEDTEKLIPFLMKIKDTKYHALVTSWIQADGSEEILRDKTEGKMKWQMAVKADGSRGVLLSGTQIRIFANWKGIFYRGRVHEKLERKGGELVCMDASEEFAILHTGYTPSEMKEKKKVERNIQLIKKELEEKPNDYKMLSFLGDSYFQQKNQKEAAYWYEKAVSCMPKRRDEESIQDAMIFKHLLVIYMELKEDKAVLNAYANGIKHFPKEADYDYLMGRNYADNQNFQKGEYHLERALQILEQYGSDRKSMLLARNLIEAWESLIQCYEKNGNLQQCVNHAVTVLKADSWRMKTLVCLLLAFRKDAQQNPSAASPAQVLAFLGNFYNFGHLESRLFVLNAAKEADYQELAAEVGKM